MKKNKKNALIAVLVILLLFIIFVSYLFKIKIEDKISNNIENEIVVDTTSRIAYVTAAEAVDYKNIFPIANYDVIPYNYKNCIYSFFNANGYLYGEKANKYFFTAVEDRANKVFTFGNFTGSTSTEPDIAFLLEENDFKSSRITIISSNCNIIFNKDYSYELPILSLMKKGEKAYLDKENPEAIPTDGILLHFKYSKKLLLYSLKTKTFEEYYQPDKEEIKAREKQKKYIYKEDQVNNSNEYEIFDENE